MIILQKIILDMDKGAFLFVLFFALIVLSSGCGKWDKFYEVKASENRLTFDSEASSSVVTINDVPHSLSLKKITEGESIVSTFEYENGGWRLDSESGTYKYFRHETVKSMYSDWCTVTLGKLSKGVQPVTVSVSDNDSGETRKCTVVVGGINVSECSIEIVQEP